MATTQIGTDLIVNVGQTMGSYILESVTQGDLDVKNADIFDEEGVLKTRLIFQTMAKTVLALVPLTGATPLVDFVKGAISAVTPLVDFYVEAMLFERTEGAARVTVTGVNLGIT